MVLLRRAMQALWRWAISGRWGKDLRASSLVGGGTSVVDETNRIFTFGCMTLPRQNCMVLTRGRTGAGCTKICYCKGARVRDCTTSQ